MSTNSTDNRSIYERSTILRLLRWLFSARTLGRLFFTILTVATIIALFYAEERWRGKRAWKHYLTQMTAKGAQLNWEAYIPPKVPDAENFAMTPFLAPMFDFLPGTQTWRDTNMYNKIHERNEMPYKLASSLGFDLSGHRADRAGRWEQGQRTDLIALLGTNDVATQKANQQTNVALAAHPTTQEQAATILLDIFKQTYDPVLDELRAASKRPYCRFNAQYEDATYPNILLPHLGMMKGLEQKIAWRTGAELILGKTNEAFNDLMLGLYVSDTVKNEPLLICEWVRIACRGILTQTIWNGMSRHQWTDAQLRQIQTWLERDDFSKETQHCLAAERAAVVRLVDQLRTGAGGMTLDSLGWAQDDNYKLLDWSPLFIWFMPSGWYYLEQISLSRGFDAYLSPFDAWQNGKTDTKGFIAALEQPVPSFEGLTFWDSVWQHRTLEAMLLPAFAKVYYKSLYAQVRSDLTQTACALELYYLANGSYPENLNALTPKFLRKPPSDLMTGKPLVYRLESPQAFTLYSVGQNLVDDGGKVGLNKNGSIKTDQGDWVWRQSGK